MKKLSWRTKLVMLFTLVLGASLLFQLFYVVPYIRNREMETTKTHQQAITRNIAREVDDNLKRFKARLTEIAETSELRNMDIVNQHQLMVDHVERIRLISSLFVMDAEGQFVSGSTDDLSPHTTKSYADQPYFTVPFEQGDPVYFVPPRCHQKGIVTTSVSVPIKSDGSVKAQSSTVGVLIGRMILNDVIGYVADFALNEGTIAYLVDSEGTVIAHSEIDLFALKEGPLSLDFTGDPQIQELITEKKKSGAEEHKHDDGTLYFSSYARLESTNWGVVAETPMHVILAKSDAMAKRLLWGNIGLFVVALAVSLVFTQQITAERKQREERINHLNSVLRTIHNVNQLVTKEKDRDRLIQGACDCLSGVAVYEARDDGQDFVFVNINRAVEQIEKVKRADLIGKSVVEMFPGVKDFGLFDVFQRVWKTGKPEHHPISIYEDERISGWRENYVYKLPTDEVVAVYDDITERKLAEEELQKIEKLKSVGVLAGGIAHDFNNLLTAILGNISLARMFSTEEEVIERLAEAEDATRRSSGLTQQLLTFSKGGAPIKKTATISELLRDTAGFALSGTNVKSAFDFPDDLWTLEIDKGQISQVIQNLAINASHAMPGGGNLKIGVENVIISDKNGLPLSAGNYIKISVEDDGVGISKEHLSKIFDPYFTTKDRDAKKGTGLGLAICYSIIEKHDGHITVYSELGVGTTFHIYLPTSQKELVTEEKVEKKWIAGEGKILVMDDEEVVRDVGSAILQRLGYDVELAEDSTEAIELYQKAKESGQPFDVVILDLTIPGGMGGKGTIKKLLEIDPEVKAIVSSGFTNDLIMSDFEQYGFSGVVDKPYDIKRLGETLQKVINL